MPPGVNIRNDHFGYAVTWFGLAAVWALMTGYLLWRIKRRDLYERNPNAVHLHPRRGPDARFRRGDAGRARQRRRAVRARDMAALLGGRDRRDGRPALCRDRGAGHARPSSATPDEAELRAMLDPRLWPLRPCRGARRSAQLDEQHWLLELFHGPTLAFKDVALQLLGLLFEAFLARSGQAADHRRRDQRRHRLGGDRRARAGAPGSTSSCSTPRAGSRDVQRRQMTTVLAPNVHNIAIEGSFDDAQALVKAMFNDHAFRDAFALAAVNSINWARLMAQVVYYFSAAVRARRAAPRGRLRGADRQFRRRVRRLCRQRAWACRSTG